MNNALIQKALSQKVARTKNTLMKEPLTGTELADQILLDGCRSDLRIPINDANRDITKEANALQQK